MRKIGIVHHVQIQTAPLKIGEGADRRYTTHNILQVASLRLTARGVIGFTFDGGELIDVHHAAHPQTRYTDKNSISLGFTSHYGAMQAKFGSHIQRGYAAENILVEIDQIILPALLGETVVIENPHTGEHVRLKDVRPALPCAPFSQFCLQNPTPTAADQKDALQFLDKGMRGFYMTLEQAAPNATITAGDVLYSV